MTEIGDRVIVDLDGLKPRRVSWLARFLDRTGGSTGEPPIPPPLPPGRVVTVPERGEMFYRVAGDRDVGVPVVLLHGWMASADLNWFRVFDALSNDHFVVAPDHRGHGRGIRAPHRFSLEACADDAAGLLRVLGIERAIVVGYSMGGPIATLLWDRHPSLVEGLVLQATALGWRDTWAERVRWRMMGLLSVLLRWQAGRLLLVRLMGQRADIPANLVPYRSWLEGEFRRSDWTDIADAGRAMGRYDAHEIATRIDVPVSVVVTARDRLIPPEKQLALAASMGAETFVFEGDHDAAVVQDDEFAAITLDAIRSLRDVRHSSRESTG